MNYEFNDAGVPTRWSEQEGFGFFVKLTRFLYHRIHVKLYWRSARNADVICHISTYCQEEMFRQNPKIKLIMALPDVSDYEHDRKVILWGHKVLLSQCYMRGIIHRHMELFEKQCERLFFKQVLEDLPIVRGAP